MYFVVGRFETGHDWARWDVADGLTTAGSTQFNRTFDDDAQSSFTLWSQSWTFGFSLTEHIGAYAEWFGFFPSGATFINPENYLDGGFTLYLFDVQWDI